MGVRKLLVFGISACAANFYECSLTPFTPRTISRCSEHKIMIGTDS